MFGSQFGEPGSPVVIAHRGGAALGRENSIEVLAHAAASGAHAVEIDVQELGDGSLILAHDSSVRRWWGLQRVRLADIDRNRYERLVGRRAVTIEDLLGRLEGLDIGLYLELKSVSTEGIQRAIDMIVTSTVGDASAMGSSRLAAVQAIVGDGRLPASILFRDRRADPVQLQRETGCSFVHPCFDDEPWMVQELAGAWMDRMHAAGLLAIGWNTNDADLLGQMVTAGFDAVCTDDPRIVEHASWRRDQ